MMIKHMKKEKTKEINCKMFKSIFKKWYGDTLKALLTYFISFFIVYFILFVYVFYDNKYLFSFILFLLLVTVVIYSLMNLLISLLLSLLDMKKDKNKFANLIINNREIFGGLATMVLIFILIYYEKNSYTLYDVDKIITLIWIIEGIVLTVFSIFYSLEINIEEKRKTEILELGKLERFFNGEKAITSYNDLLKNFRDIIILLAFSSLLVVACTFIYVYKIGSTGETNNAFNSILKFSFVLTLYVFVLLIMVVASAIIVRQMLQKIDLSKKKEEGYGNFDINSLEKINQENSDMLDKISKKNGISKENAE